MADDPKSAPDLTAAITALLAKQGGDATKAISQLLEENHDYRGKNRDLKARVAELEKAAPAQGAVVLTGDAVKELEDYRALGKPAEVKSKLDAATTATGKLAAYELKEQHRTAADTLGWKVAVLSRLLTKDDGSPARDIEVREEKVDGKDVKVAYVRTAGDDKAPWKKAEEELKDFLPALTAGDASDKSSGPRKGGDPYIPQRRETGAPGGGTSTEQVATQKRATGAYSF